MEDEKKDENQPTDNSLSFEKLTEEITKLREEKTSLQNENEDLRKAYNKLYENGSFTREEKKDKPKKTLSYDDINI